MRFTGYGIASKVNVQLKSVAAIVVAGCRMYRVVDGPFAAFVEKGEYEIVRVVFKYSDGNKGGCWKYIFSIPIYPNVPVGHFTTFPNMYVGLSAVP